MLLSTCIMPAALLLSLHHFSSSIRGGMLSRTSLLPCTILKVGAYRPDLGLSSECHDPHTRGILLTTWSDMYYSSKFLSMSTYSVISLSDCAAVSSSSEDAKRRRHSMASLYRRAGLLIWRKILHGIPEIRRTLGFNHRRFPRLWVC